MKKLSIEQLETTLGGGKLRTCFLGGIFTGIGVGIGIGIGNYAGAGTALVAGLSAANYKGCLD